MDTEKFGKSWRYIFSAGMDDRLLRRNYEMQKPRKSASFFLLFLFTFFRKKSNEPPGIIFYIRVEKVKTIIQIPPPRASYLIFLFVPHKNTWLSVIEYLRPLFFLCGIASSVIVIEMAVSPPPAQQIHNFFANFAGVAETWGRVPSWSNPRQYRTIVW